MKSVAMLIKSYETREDELIENARASIQSAGVYGNNSCYIPYIDILSEEIRYLHFEMRNECWVLKTDNRN